MTSWPGAGIPAAAALRRRDHRPDWVSSSRPGSIPAPTVLNSVAFERALLFALGLHLPGRVGARFARIAAVADARPARMVTRTPLAPIVNPCATTAVVGATIGVV